MWKCIGFDSFACGIGFDLIFSVLDEFQLINSNFFGLGWFLPRFCGFWLSLDDKTKDYVDRNTGGQVYSLHLHIWAVERKNNFSKTKIHFHKKATPQLSGHIGLQTMKVMSDLLPFVWCMLILALGYRVYIHFHLFGKWKRYREYYEIKNTAWDTSTNA